jgi:2-amino-4-hydroxy-6-hydroxymethyldihydropteridine diphosphokinase
MAQIAQRDAIHFYAIGMGSNRPLSQQLTPRAIIHAAMVALDLPPFHVLARSRVITSAPVGPSLRHYANAAILVASPLPPQAMLTRLQALETRFHRKRTRRWGARTLDLDLLLWSGGHVRSRRLNIPHTLMREREFVLGPLNDLVPKWRDPVTGFTIAQLAARLRKARARPKAG